MTFGTGFSQREFWWNFMFISIGTFLYLLYSVLLNEVYLRDVKLKSDAVCILKKSLIRYKHAYSSQGRTVSLVLGSCTLQTLL